MGTRTVEQKDGDDASSEVTALVLEGAFQFTVGGLTLTERSVLLAHRMDLRPVYVWGTLEPDRAVDARLQSRGVAVLRRSPGAPPLEPMGEGEAILVVGPAVLCEPAVLRNLLVQAERHADGPALTARDGAGSPLLLYVPRDAVASVRACPSIESMAAILAEQGRLRNCPLAGGFLRRIDSAEAARAAERDYIRHLNGLESYFTKKIRRFSVPLTSRLARLGARPTHVTFGGLALAAASAWCLAQGQYLLGVLGGILYYASMVFDCSDGEVARLTLRDSAFGAWLETIVDYVTYFLILGALAAASQELPGAAAHRVATVIAFVGSLVVAGVAGYLRHRVAAADPGQFDDASARVMASAGRLQRFARWGRQWIKRSTVAHLVLALALVNQLPALLYLWAFGAVVASTLILAVEPFVVRRVTVGPAKQ